MSKGFRMYIPRVYDVSTFSEPGHVSRLLLVPTLTVADVVQCRKDLRCTGIMELLRTDGYRRPDPYIAGQAGCRTLIAKKAQFQTEEG